MICSRAVIVVVLQMILSVMVAAGSARAGSTVASSSAFGMTAQFVDNGHTVVFSPIAQIQFSAPPAYSRTATIADYSKIVPIVAGNIPAPVMFVNAASSSLANLPPIDAC